MGFNKKYVTKESIERQIKLKKPLKELFRADGFIFIDELSTKVYEMICNGYSDEQVVEFFTKNKIDGYEN